jgi:hypothetical protein
LRKPVGALNKFMDIPAFDTELSSIHGAGLAGNGPDDLAI